MILLEDQR